MARKTQRLWDRFDLLYARERRWPYNWLRRLSVLLCLVLGIALAIWAVREESHVYSPGPLARAHAMFETDCARCHQPSSEGAPYWLPVTDEACLACHNAPAHRDIHQARFAGPTMGLSDRLGQERMAGQCVQCHIEHHGVECDLKHVADSRCTECHSDLAGYATLAGSSSKASIADEIDSFVDAHPPFRATEPGVIDTTPLEFGHQEHMSARFYPKMQEKLESWVSAMRKAGISDHDIPVHRDEPDAFRMTCAACHEADAAGQYMQPIVFEQHCEQCHALGERDGEAVPHALDVKAFISRAAVAQVLKPPKKASSRSGPRRGPRKSAGAAKQNAAMTPTQFKEKITQAEQAITPPTLGRCMQCHGPVKSFDEIADPNIPDRWMDRSTFSHTAHRALDCAQCHPRATGAPQEEVVYPGEDDPNSSANVMSWTGRTRDVMMPDIDSCRTCHGPAHAKSAGVRHECVVCHVFHGTETDVTRHGLPIRPMTVDRFLGLRRDRD